MQLVAAFALALCLLGFMVYWASLKTRRRIAHVYGALAAQWEGQVAEGSFFRPPVLRYEVDGIRAELSAFYLRRGTFSGWLARLRASDGKAPGNGVDLLPPHGSRPGHYTQLRFQLDRRVIESFVINVDPASPTGYRVESLRPALPTRLLDEGWAEALHRIEAIRDRGGAHVRFDGDTLTVRKGALLMTLPNIETFASTCARLVTELDEALGDRGVRL